MNKIINSRIFRLLFGILFIAAGIFVIVKGALRIKNRDLYDAQTTAVITEIEEDLDTSGDTIDYTYTVYVDYEVDGKKYTHVLFPEYNSGMNEGDVVDILYRSDSPDKIEIPNNLPSSILTIVLGAVAMIIGAVIDIKVLRS